MPNPFLERPTLWDSFHNAFVVEINRALVTNLPNGFATRTDARCYVSQGEERIRIIKPDDILIGGQSASADGSTHFEQPSPLDPQPKLTTPPTGIAIRQPVEVRQLFLEIIDMDNEEQVVTIIEVLSPSNKARGVKGRADYRRKQNAVLSSDTNLLEIDLLRGGLHTIAAPQEYLQRAGGGTTPFRCIARTSRTSIRSGSVTCTNLCRSCPCRSRIRMRTWHWICNLC